MRTIPTVIGILLLVVLTSAAWIMRYRPQWLQTTAEEAADDEDIDPQKLEIPVHTGTVVRTTLHRYVEAFGVVEPSPPRPGRMAGTADVAAAAPGVVAEVLCEAGQKVAKGTPLVQLDSRLARAAQQQAAAALAEAKASLAQLKATPRAELLEISELAVEKARTAVEFAEKGYTRQQGLARQQGTSEKNVEQASLELASAKNDLATAQKQLAMLKASPTPEELAQQAAKVAQAEAALAAAQAQEDMLKIVAPIDGMVIAVSARAGEAVDPTKVLVDIVALDRLVINVPVPEAEARMLTVGMSVDVTLVAGAATTQPTSAQADTAPPGPNLLHWLGGGSQDGLDTRWRGHRSGTAGQAWAVGETEDCRRGAQGPAGRAQGERCGGRQRRHVHCAGRWRPGDSQDRSDRPARGHARRSGCRWP